MRSASGVLRINGELALLDRLHIDLYSACNTALVLHEIAHELGHFANVHAQHIVQYQYLAARASAKALASWRKLAAASSLRPCTQ